MSLYSPVLATYRLAHTPKHLVARALSAWSIGRQASIAVRCGCSSMQNAYAFQSTVPGSRCGADSTRRRQEPVSRPVWISAGPIFLRPIKSGSGFKAFRTGRPSGGSVEVDHRHQELQIRPYGAEPGDQSSPPCLVRIR